MEENKNQRFSQIISKSMSQLIVILLAIIIFFAFYRFSEIMSVFKLILGTIQPILIGLCLGYVLKRPQKFFHKKIYKLFTKYKIIKKEKKRDSICKGLSIFIAMVMFLVTIYILIIMAVPEIVENIFKVTDTLPEQVNRLIKWVSERMKENSKYADMFEKILKEATDYITRWVKNDMMTQIGQLASGIISAVSVFVNAVVGVIVAVYVLSSKETFAKQGKKIIYAIFKEKHAEKILKEFKKSDDIFGGFISGKIIDSLIIGALCFVGLTILDMPYTMLVSTIVGVTNVIPFFGPYIGAVPSAILILLADPKKGLIFIVFIILLQQLDGNIIGPKILGDSTGLNSLWVIFAITVFGGIFGVFGMFIGVPVFAVIYAAIKTFVEERLKRKQLPYETTYYMQSDYHSDDVVKNTGKEIKFVKKTFEHIYVEGKGTQVKVVIQPDDSESKSDDISETTNIIEEK